MTEQDKLQSHDSDGILEYDNAAPGWWTWTFIGSIFFAIGYLFFYGMNYGGDNQASYAQEVIRETAAVQAWYTTHPVTPPSPESLLAGASDPAVLELGRGQYLKSCASCHGEKAEGLIGPNLCDPNWIHGGSVVEIWTTVSKGVPAKGMPTWGRAFKPEVVAALASYVRSVQGSAPANAKPPEGPVVEMEPLTSASGASVTAAP